MKNKEVIEYLEKRISTLKDGIDETRKEMKLFMTSYEEDEALIDIEISRNIIRELSIVLEKLK